jgi:formate dehydrogenase iron-sulfur subunit
MEKAILFDPALCTACRACQVACKQWNANGGVQTTSRGSYENPSDLTPETWLKIEFREVERNGRFDWLFTRRACMHCTDAACVRVCPTGALRHHELGFVTYDKDLCSGCGYCRDFCPFDTPRSERDFFTGLAKMEKCTLCMTPGLDRVAAGYEPACVKSCPTDALKYGDRGELLAEGKKRIQALQARGRTNAYLYGEKELGGLHVMYVLDDAPKVYGLPADPRVPPATAAWKDILQPLGWAAGALTLVGLGLNYLVSRKTKLARECAGKKEEGNGARS